MRKAAMEERAQVLEVKVRQLQLAEIAFLHPSRSSYPLSEDGREERAAHFFAANQL